MPNIFNMKYGSNVTCKNIFNKTHQLEQRSGRVLPQARPINQSIRESTFINQVRPSRRFESFVLPKIENIDFPSVRRRVLSQCQSVSIFNHILCDDDKLEDKLIFEDLIGRENIIMISDKQKSEFAKVLIGKRDYGQVKHDSLKNQGILLENISL